MTSATLLTPPGTGAIATIAINGPDAWLIAKKLFSKPLPDSLPVKRFWFGSLAGDDVILAVTGSDSIEIHCHGGRRIVQVILDQLRHEGCEEKSKPTRGHGWAFEGWELLENATTLRTAGMLLDQLQGAFEQKVNSILQEPNLDGLQDLAALAPLGRHLTVPWKIVLAGAPNVGKSSLLNALAGFERAVVSPIAGTTRDAVSLPAAFDGWPVELTDTAGVRHSSDELESAGIARAKQVILETDLLMWVLDASAEPVWPEKGERQPDLVAANKCDLPSAIIPTNTIRVSAKTGEGIASLIAAMVRRIVPVAPKPGDAVPYTPELADAVETAATLARTGKVAAARERLATCLSPRD